MNDSIVVAKPPPELAARLQEIAQDPAMIRQLHGILGRFFHEIRNDLNGIKMSLYMVGKSDFRGFPAHQRILGDAQADYDRLEHIVERVHRFCRNATIAPVLLPVTLLFEDRGSSWREALLSRDRTLSLQPPREELAAAFDPSRLGQALDDLFAWRLDVAEAGSELRISWRKVADLIELEWHERMPAEGFQASAASGGMDGRGASESERERVLDMLSLPMLTQAVALHGGVVEIATNDGWKLRLRWPCMITETFECCHVDESCLDRTGSATAIQRPLHVARG